VLLRGVKPNTGGDQAGSPLGLGISSSTTRDSGDSTARPVSRRDGRQRITCTRSLWWSAELPPYPGPSRSGRDAAARKPHPGSPYVMRRELGFDVKMGTYTITYRSEGVPVGAPGSIEADRLVMNDRWVQFQDANGKGIVSISLKYVEAIRVESDRTTHEIRFETMD
jgi:hypothetical protein